MTSLVVRLMGCGDPAGDRCGFRLRLTDVQHDATYTDDANGFLAYSSRGAHFGTVAPGDTSTVHVEAAAELSPDACTRRLLLDVQVSGEPDGAFTFDVPSTEPPLDENWDGEALDVALHFSPTDTEPATATLNFVLRSESAIPGGAYDGRSAQLALDAYFNASDEDCGGCAR